LLSSTGGLISIWLGLASLTLSLALSDTGISGWLWHAASGSSLAGSAASSTDGEVWASSGTLVVLCDTVVVDLLTW